MEALQELQERRVDRGDYKQLCDKGIVSRECLELLYQTGPDLLEVELLWEFLLEFNLGMEIKNPPTKGTESGLPSLFIPSLIRDENRDKFIRKSGILEKIKKDPNTRGIYFSFDKAKQPYSVFNQVLSKLASGAHVTAIFEKAFATKIENREVGIVAAMSGRLKWRGIGGREDVVNFVVSERDHNAYDRDQTFGRHKVECLIYQSKQNMHFHSILPTIYFIN